MNKEDIILKTKSYVEKELGGEGSGHDWNHVRRVWINAKSLVKEEGVDGFVIELAALLHDVDDWKITGKAPGEVSEKAKEFLNTLDISSAIIDEVIDVIKSIDYRGSIEKAKTETIEAKIVYDADKLDAIGAIGIARCFAFSGNKRMSIFEAEAFPISAINEEQYTDLKRKTNTAINHFFEKLLRLKTRFNTESARKEAHKRHQFMVDYLERFFDEHDDYEWKNYLDEFIKERGL